MAEHLSPEPTPNVPPTPRRGNVALKTALAGVIGLGGLATGYNTYQGSMEKHEREALQGQVDRQRGEMGSLLGTVDQQKQEIGALLQRIEEERAARSELGERFGQAWKEGQAYFQKGLQADAAHEERLAKAEQETRLLRELVTKLDGELTVEELHEVIEKTRCSLVAIGPIENPASGFFINNCQFIVTNNHVTEALTKWGYAKDGQYPIALHTSNRGEEPFTFFATLEKAGGKGTPLKDASSSYQGGSDLVVLRVPEQVRKNLPKWVRSAQLRDTGRRPIKSGEVAIVVGNPRGLRSSINVGRVSHGERHFDIGPGGPNPLYPVVQVDADMNGGNSGGLTVDAQGELMGVSFYGHGPGLNHARHVLNLKAELQDHGIDTPISKEERATLERWGREHAAIRTRDEARRKETAEQARRLAEERRIREETERKRREDEQKNREKEAEKKRWNSVHW